jgi:predicted NBD/HSP70 family sugar kinase
MNDPEFALTPPRVPPPLDPGFRPAVLANQAFQRAARESRPQPVGLALEQADGSIFQHQMELLPEDHPRAAANLRHLERRLKFLLWSRGAFRVHFAGPPGLAAALRQYYRETSTGRFDAQIMGGRVYERPFEIVETAPGGLPPPRENSAPLGRHLEGCRIGFDLGGSDRKAASVIDGNCVFSDEVVWSPMAQSDPQWHFDQIMASLESAARRMPRVDAIGGSAAGVYVNNRVKVASLFRGVPPALFESRVKDLFLELKKAWKGIPFEVVNDGEVTALAGSMALGQNAVLGLAMGTSQAAGYVTPEGNITTWLNELAFAPVDHQPDAPVDEWSGDRGCGALYFSQQAVGRLAAPAGLGLPEGMPLPEKLRRVQALMEENDARARGIYETIGVYLGYAIAHYADFYDFDRLLLLGRVTTGAGGGIIVGKAEEVLRTEFPPLAARIGIHVPDERDKRHGQAIAAASLPKINRPGKSRI